MPRLRPAGHRRYARGSRPHTQAGPARGDPQETGQSEPVGQAGQRHRPAVVPAREERQQHARFNQQRRQIVPAPSEWTRAQVSTIREKLLKEAARVRVRCRTVRVQVPASYPWQGLWRTLL